MVFFESQGDCWKCRLSSSVSWNWILQNEDGKTKVALISLKQQRTHPYQNRLFPSSTKARILLNMKRGGPRWSIWEPWENQRDGTLEPSPLCTASRPAPQPAEGCTPKAKLAACWLGAAPVGLLLPDLTVSCLILLTHWKRLASQPPHLCLNCQTLSAGPCRQQIKPRGSWS